MAMLGSRSTEYSPSQERKLEHLLSFCSVRMQRLYVHTGSFALLSNQPSLLGSPVCPPLLALHPFPSKCNEAQKTGDSGPRAARTVCSARGCLRACVPLQAGAFILGKMKETAEAHVGGPVSHAVVTVPAY